MSPWKIYCVSALESALYNIISQCSLMIVIGPWLLWREQESICDTFLGHLVMAVTRQCGFEYGSPVTFASGNEFGGVGGGRWSS